MSYWPEDKSRIQALLKSNMERTNVIVEDIETLLAELDKLHPTTLEREQTMLELHEFLKGLDSLRRHQSRAYHLLLTMDRRISRPQGRLA